MTAARRVAFAPGRVNLIGDHTDYAGGLVLPMAIQLGTTVSFAVGGDVVELRSTDEPEPAVVPLAVADPSGVQPAWARYVAGVVSSVSPAVGGTGTVTTTLPIGAGLSSSAALEVAVALALGFDGPPLALAQACQAAEQRASGVPCGVMDQLAAAAGVEGHALLIDCGSLAVTPVPLPPADEAEIVVIHSGQSRELAGSAYGQRRAEWERGFAPRVRHVESESERVEQFARAMQQGDLSEAGRLMLASHASLRDDFEVSTPVLDSLIERLIQLPGVFGARLTGAGFGGCVVALARPGALDGVADRHWQVRPSAGAYVETS